MKVFKRILSPLTSFRMPGMSMTRRLSLGFGLVVILFSGTAAIAISQMRSLEGNIEQAMRAATEVSGHAVTMRDSIQRTYTNMLLISMVSTKDDLEFQIKELNDSTADYVKSKAALNAAIASGELSLSPEMLSSLDEGEVSSPQHRIADSESSGKERRRSLGGWADRSGPAVAGPGRQHRGGAIHRLDQKRQ